MLNIDEAIQKCGDNGLYQMRLFLIASLITFVLSTQLMSPTYMYIQPKLYCNGEVLFKLKQICEDDYKACEEGNFTIDPDFKYQNIVTEFNLFCDRKQYIVILSTINFFGSMIGGSILSSFADKFGRQKILILSLALTNVGFLGIFMSGSIFQLMLFTFIMGFFEVGVYILIPVLINEISGSKIKQNYSTGTLIFWCLGEIAIALGFFYLSNWRTVQFIFVVVPGLVSLILTCIFIKESPRYYYFKKNYDQVTFTLKYISSVNQIEYQDFNLIPAEDNSATYSVADLFKSKTFRSSSFGFILISYGLHLIYYGGQYQLQEIAKDSMIYQLGIYIGISELLGYTVITLMIDKLYRKYYQIFFFCIQIIGCFAFLCYGITEYQLSCEKCLQEIVIILLCCLIRFFNSFGFAILRQHSTEFYPTPIRGTGSGLMFTIGVFGSFSSSYMIALANILNVNQIAFLGFCSLSGVLGAILTRETLNMKNESLTHSQIEEVTN